jgi:hypothetical protein
MRIAAAIDGVPHDQFGVKNAIHAIDAEGILDHSPKVGARRTLRRWPQKRRPAGQNSKQISAYRLHRQLPKE